jgi:hypothetical protein
MRMTAIPSAGTLSRVPFWMTLSRMGRFAKSREGKARLCRAKSRAKTLRRKEAEALAMPAPFVPSCLRASHSKGPLRGPSRPLGAFASWREIQQNAPPARKRCPTSPHLGQPVSVNRPGPCLNRAAQGRGRFARADCRPVTPAQTRGNARVFSYTQGDRVRKLSPRKWPPIRPPLRVTGFTCNGPAKETRPCASAAPRKSKTANTASA